MNDDSLRKEKITQREREIPKYDFNGASQLSAFHLQEDLEIFFKRFAHLPGQQTKQGTESRHQWVAKAARELRKNPGEGFEGPGPESFEEIGKESGHEL